MATKVGRGISDIWGSSATDVFAVGNNGLILHYNGINWAPMNSGTTHALIGIWGRSATDVFAVGNNGLILHYNGINWAPMNSGPTSQLFEVLGQLSN